MKTDKEIEIRSEEVQEVMGQIPSRIVRWGITILFIVVLALVVGSFFFKYPDVITTEMTLTGQSPAVQIVARASGKMAALYVREGEAVQAGTLLAVVENPADTEDVLSLKEMLIRYAYSPDSFLMHQNTQTAQGTRGNQNTQGRQSIQNIQNIPPVQTSLSLGEVQSTYSSFLGSMIEYRNYRALDYYPKKLASTRRQIAKYRTYYESLYRQQEVMEAQHTIASGQYARDSLLFTREVLSPAEHETARAVWLQSRYSLEGTSASLENLEIQIGQLEETLLDLELQQAERESVLLQNWRTSTELLGNAITGWELNYCLRSPIGGRVTFTTYWNENQYIQAGAEVFTVVPGKAEALIGKALLPVQRSGKVKTGQRVIVRFMNYPDEEFGVVNGIVSSISLVPSESNYMVEIGFPDGLTTNYGMNLPLSHEMQATAEIVTDDLRLLERFFMPLRKIWKEGVG